MSKRRTNLFDDAFFDDVEINPEHQRDLGIAAAGRAIEHGWHYDESNGLADVASMIGLGESA